MKRHRRLALVLGGLVMGTAAFVACGFPDVAFAPEDSGTKDATTDKNVPDTGMPDSANDATTTDATIDVEEVPDTGPRIDANLLDVAVPEDAGGKVDASGCQSCDCDQDGFNKPDCGIGPFDCDDNDSRSHPNQVFLDNDAEAPMNGNWNCDDKVEKAYPEGGTCNSSLLGLACTAVYGFTTTVQCGTKGTFIQCINGGLLGLSCMADPDSVDKNKVQVCK